MAVILKTYIELHLRTEKPTDSKLVWWSGEHYRAVLTLLLILIIYLFLFIYLSIYIYLFIYLFTYLLMCLILAIHYFLNLHDCALLHKKQCRVLLTSVH